MLFFCFNINWICNGPDKRIPKCITVQWRFSIQKTQHQHPIQTITDSVTRKSITNFEYETSRFWGLDFCRTVLCFDDVFLSGEIEYWVPCKAEFLQLNHTLIKKLKIELNRFLTTYFRYKNSLSQHPRTDWNK